MLNDKSTTNEEDDGDDDEDGLESNPSDSQPIKRRRIASMHSSLEEHTVYYQRIQCRRPIRRMQSTL